MLSMLVTEETEAQLYRVENGDPPHPLLLAGHPVSHVLWLCGVHGVALKLLQRHLRFRVAPALAVY